jgi:SAM-dependent methyltransferase
VRETVTNSVSFDRAADYYDDTRGIPAEQQQRFTDLIVTGGGWTDASRVLEIGVGTGRIALPVSQQVGAVFGLDLSRQMMGKLIEKRHNEPVRLTQGDATRLPFPPTCLDGAVATHVFHLIPDWRAAVEEIRRILTPGARFVSAWSRVDLYDLWNEMKERVEVNISHIGLDDKQEMFDFLAETGWQRLDSAEASYQRPMYLEAFAARITGRQHSWTWRVDDATLARAETEFRAILSERYGSLDQSVPVEASYGVDVFERPA